MALDPALLEILACPDDKGPLYYIEDEQVLFAALHGDGFGGAAEFPAKGAGGFEPEFAVVDDRFFEAAQLALLLEFRVESFDGSLFLDPAFDRGNVRFLGEHRRWDQAGEEAEEE